MFFVSCSAGEMYLPLVLSGNLISISSFFAPFFTLSRSPPSFIGAPWRKSHHHPSQQHCHRRGLLPSPQQQQQHHHHPYFWEGSITPEEKQLWPIDAAWRLSLSPHLSSENRHIIICYMFISIFVTCSSKKRRKTLHRWIQISFFQSLHTLLGKTDTLLERVHPFKVDISSSSIKCAIFSCLHSMLTLLYVHLKTGGTLFPDAR